MSVPPVEPLCRNTMASDVPVITHPSTSDMKSWSPSRRIILPFSSVMMSCATPRSIDSMTMAYTVLTMNFHPITFRATTRSRKFMVK